MINRHISRRSEDDLIKAFNILEAEDRKLFRFHLLRELGRHVDENGEIRITSKDLRDWLKMFKEQINVLHC